MMRYAILIVLCQLSCQIFALTKLSPNISGSIARLPAYDEICYSDNLHNTDLESELSPAEHSDLVSWEYAFENHKDFDKWYWISCPILDTITVKACRAYNIFDELFHTHFSNNFEFLPTYLDEILWRENGETSRIRWVMSDWTPQHDYHTVTYPQGYKIHIRPRISNDYPARFAVHLQGYVAPNDLKFPIYGNTENWIGYFLREAQTPEKALGAIWDDVLIAKTKDWCLIRSHESGEMIGISSPLNFGDMLVLITRNNHNLKWSSYNPDVPILKRNATFFAYREKQDYIPVFITLPDKLVREIDEISLYIRGECMGAVVVNSSMEQISAYMDNINDLTEGKIELAFYSDNKKADFKLGYLVLAQDRLQAKYSAAGSRYPYLEIKVTNEDINRIIPPAFTLGQNYPNPFNPTTTISYQLKEPGKVYLEIYNLRGQLVKSLVAESQEAGYHSMVWNGTDSNNRNVASGVYLYRLKSNNNVQTKRMLLMK